MPATAHPSAYEFIPERPTIPKLWQAAQGCTACDLYKRATQAVLGEGPRDASAFFIGEQPGDQEDLAGKPFVGPAGRVLDEALVAAGIPRQEVFVTNAVKHFKWEPRGKRRIHGKPSTGEVKACRPWLETELALIQPEVIVCLGSTAAQALMGPKFKITVERGKFFETPWAPWLTTTFHPSAILRMPDDVKRREAREMFVDDLRLVAKRLRAAVAK
ncbi:MAG TPA: UdgX family uracil-DNA binding protein [Thermoanaerobaculia bacterium]|jgi:DNA polymerase